MSLIYEIKVNWGSGFGADVTLKGPLTNWTVAFDVAANITSIWNAVIDSHSGNRYVLKPASWNASVATGASVIIGFNATPLVSGNGGVNISNVVLTGTGPTPVPTPTPTPT